MSDYGINRFESLPSRKSVKKAIKRGLLLVNGKRSTTAHRVKEGEEITVVADTTVRPVYERKLSVLFEDKWIAAVLKPADLPVSGNSFRTLQNALSFNLIKVEALDALPVPVPTHRLDRQTGGVVLIAKTRSSAANLGKQFELREVDKTYLAVAAGEIRHSQVIRHAIDKKEARTEIQPLELIQHKLFGPLTVLNALPKTGRTNQIRIHLALEGHPILGDLKFGNLKSGKGLYLFAETIVFRHPIKQSLITVQAPVPNKFRKLGTRALR